MQVMKVDELIPHKMNDYFFDDITGEPWEDFLRSVKTSGVIEPVIATQDKVIVSGHQRIRACKKLGIKEVAVEIRHYESDDEVLKQLIETNICQRGLGNTNPVKLGRCIKRMEEFYGIAHGGDRKSSGHNDQLKSQDDLAEELRMSKSQMTRYKRLTDLIPELQDAVMSGQITATTAMGFVKKLSPEEQVQLAEQIGSQEKISGSEVQKYIDEIKAVRDENAKLRSAISEQGAMNATLKRKLEERPPVKVEVKEVEVAPADYKTVKAKAKEADAWKKDYQREQMKVSEKNKEILELNNRIDELKNQTAQATSSAKLVEGSIYFVARCGSFVRDMGGYVWIADKIAELPESERVNFMKAIRAIHDWAEALQQNVERGI